MRKAIKISIWTLTIILVLAIGTLSLFIYKVMYGFPVSYETEIPLIDFPPGKTSVLLFSKSTGFRHSESIESGNKVFEELAERNGWFLYSTESGGVFNPEQLSKFNVVIFNNCTGRLLNKEQQKNLENYVEGEGHWIGIHGAGDNSHHWDWYEDHLVGGKFSHHALENQLQEATVHLDPVPDSGLVEGLPESWSTTDEWYVFYENPAKKGFKVLYHIDGEKINPSGNILWIKSKGFGMGKEHPVAWYRATGKGTAFYTSMGHNVTSWQQPAFVKMLENAVKDSEKKN